MSTFDGRIVGAGDIPWWSPGQVLAANYCVCRVCVYVCVCVELLCLHGIYYSGPS